MSPPWLLLIVPGAALYGAVVLYLAFVLWLLKNL